jgi:hypothetical protein
MKEFKIDQYRLFYVSGPSDYEAKITCYNGEVRVAKIIFINTQAELPANELQSTPMNIYYRIGSFSNIHKIIQTENPLSIFVYDNGETCEIGKREIIL